MKSTVFSSLFAAITASPETELLPADPAPVPVDGSFSLAELSYKGWIGIMAERGQLPSWTWFAMIALCCVASYLLGSINFAVIISRKKFHDDIRNHGSGNAGATNMIRTFGNKAGVMTFLGDILKAVVSVLLAWFLCGKIMAYLAGLFCSIGHAFPCYYRFKGGKTVAVTAAAALVTEPLVFLILLIVFVIMVAFTKYISLGSISAALMYPLILHNILQVRFGHSDLRILFVFLTSALLIWLHRSNIKRLLNGEESKFSFKKKKQ